MTKFRAVVVGENFLVELEGQRRKVSFFTTRYVEGATPEEAEEAAVRALAADPGMGEAVLNDHADPPMLHVHELEPVDSFEEIEETPPLVYQFEDGGGEGEPTR